MKPILRRNCKNKPVSSRHHEKLIDFDRKIFFFEKKRTTVLLTLLNGHGCNWSKDFE